LARNPDPGQQGRELDASGGQGLQIGEGNEQRNQYIGTYVQHQVIEGASGASAQFGPADSAPDMGTDSRRPGMFSLRPPLGNLPVRIRGRDQLIKKLQRRLGNSPDQIQVLYGLGGCGKTTIALGLARYAREHGYSVYWVPAAGEDRLTTGMRAIARELNASEDEINNAWAGLASAMDLVWRCLDAASVPWLLVLDNADDPARLASDEGSPGDGTGWARPSARGMTVVTTRTGSAETWGHGAERHLVDVLGSDDGADILIDLAGQVGTAGEARNLAVRLGGLPLALRLAGSYLARASRGAGILRHRNRAPSGLRTFVAYTAALGDLGTSLLDESAFHSSTDIQLERLHRQLVGRTWEISLDLLHRQGMPEARMIMRLLSCFAATPFPADLIDIDLLKGSGLLPDTTLADQVDRALESLVDFSLLEVVAVADVTCLVAHRLVLEANAQRLSRASSEDQASVWCAAASLLHSVTELAAELPVNWESWRLLTPHIRAAVAAVPSEDPGLVAQVIKISLCAFAYLWFSGSREEAASLVEALMKRSEVLEADNPLRLSIRHRYALAKLKGKEAAKEYANVLHAQRQLLGVDDPETLITHYNWAESLIPARRLAEAEKELRTVLEARRRVLGPSDPYTLITQSSIAHVMAARGHSDQASSQYEELMLHLESGNHSDHRFVPLEARHQMAHILDKRRKFTDAEVEYRSVLSELETLNEIDSGLYRDMIVCLARNLSSQKRYPEAMTEMDKALSLLAQPDSRQRIKTTRILSVRHERADILRSMKQYAQAETEMRAVLESRTDSGEQEDSVILQERHCLAHALIGQGKDSEAESELRHVVSAYEAILGPGGDQVRPPRYCLARVLQRQGCWLEAESQYKVVLAAEAQVIGPDHTDALVTKFRLAQVQYAGGTSTRAETLEVFNAILAKQEEIVGEQHARTREVRKERDRIAAEPN
jgi:tetratricopeptide (TPR) repeat protein